MFIFVYGTIRKKLPLHRLVDGCKFIGEAFTASKYTLYSLGNYPGLKCNGKSSILGEIYEVIDRYQIHVLDMVESSYIRKPIEIIEIKNENTNKEVKDIIFDILSGHLKVEAYIYNYDCKKENEIFEGDWKKYIKNKFLCSFGVF